MLGKIVFIIIISSFHILLGVINFIVGILSSIRSRVWMAHTVSPIWSGILYIVSGLCGLAMFKQRSQYTILCFAASNSMTLIATIVNMQFLRYGLVNHTTLGRTFQKENKDILLIIGLFVSGLELLNCLISFSMSFKLNHDAKNNRFKTHRKEGAFFVQIVSDKDIVVVQSKANKNQNGLFSAQAISVLIKNNLPKTHVENV
ncbi:unnamed protein product [Brachionus calyciflorus]|uniref:Transmembrane protein 196 n=1 Tax=Brachionus calyciflorus TaxID=104777 RepID=A0A814GXU1_9BILA|nr:unnamed protein product [Brachionus calyciflorus]